MNDRLHPTALISNSAQIEAAVSVGPYSIIHSEVLLKEGVTIGAHCEIGGSGAISIGPYTVIDSHVKINGVVSIGARATVGFGALITGRSQIGDNTTIFNHCSIGTLSQHPAFGSPKGHVIIGVGTTIREFCTVQIATELRATRIGNGCYLMSGCRINHDCDIDDDVKMADGVILAGAVTVGPHAYLGMGCSVHQCLRIGAFTMIGMNATIVRNVPPYATIIDRHFARINGVGMLMRGATNDDIAAVEMYFRNQGADLNNSPWLARIADFNLSCAGEPVLRLQARDR